MDKPQVAQKAPYVLEEEPCTKAWCACGLSKTQPFCDGSHKGTGLVPKRTKITEARKVAWCGCKQTKNPPYCDGSHSSL